VGPFVDIGWVPSVKSVNVLGDEGKRIKDKNRGRVRGYKTKVTVFVVPNKGYGSTVQGSKVQRFSSDHRRKAGTRT
jgi:hypothetical protein